MTPQAIVEALRERFPQLQAPRMEDICYATQNRQDAVKRLLEQCDVLVVVGSRSSSNSNRLRELADRAGMPGYLVDGPDDLQREWFDGPAARWASRPALRRPKLLVQQVVRAAARLGRQSTPQRNRRPRGERGVQPAAQPARRTAG